MRKLIRSIEILLGEDLMDDRARIYKDDNGYSVCLNTSFLEVFPLTMEGYDLALDRLLLLVHLERRKYD
jgi:hypothetical protein